ncbi:XRE family transcriptional regulator [Verminephrobacter aporrectodeae subsp. tuberculatae]|uniref:XRE family transcriptional regulator n=1 Tax=Verminephrobacter aporrectodeae subsp. tuberculatae TaxID=1110392 RepID=A0ABT3KQG8_9BURK|nr:helix-turn-helix transcriptional regulator [Verminephrobacter aporrectodeae]MCW5320564.1 XRE family transcriptional regulator [Verminephrobacter aporrectodeae subsp. tuberculatae]
MNSIGDRILQERERLSLTQPVLAEKCGVTMRSQRNYEKGHRSPDADYLAVLAQQGLDVLYILTNQRSGCALSKEEVQLLTAFRASSKARKACMLEVSEAFSVTPGPAHGGASIHVGGNVTQAIGGDATFGGKVRIGPTTKR